MEIFGYRYRENSFTFYVFAVALRLVLRENDTIHYFKTQILNILKRNRSNISVRVKEHLLSMSGR